MGAAVSKIDSGILFYDKRGAEIRGELVRATRDAIVFEMYSANPAVEAGEALDGLTVIRGGRTVYSGGVTVDSVMSTGWNLMVSASPVGASTQLDEAEPRGRLFTEADALVRDWETAHALVPAYQLAVTNIRSFLTHIGRWISQVDPASPTFDQQYLSNWSTNLAEDVYEAVAPRLRQLFGNLEEATGLVQPEQVPAHRTYVQEELHPLMLCAPFVHRAYTKPLGYAGDYETVNMILRNRMEGNAVYAGIVHRFVLSADTGEGHRNRIDRLVDYLKQEAARVTLEGRPLRVLNIGCGPAEEIRRFMKSDPLAERCEFTLLDFNQETIEYARKQLAEAARETGRNPGVTFVHRSVNDLIKEAARGGHDEALRGRSDEAMPSYDLVYCAGLFDYLSDRICTRLMQLFYSWARPAGAVVVTNVHPGHKSHAMMEDVLDWHLILRSEADMLALAPKIDGPVSVSTEPAGVNVFMEMRKPG